MAPMLVRRLLLVLLVLLSRAESGRPPTPAPPLVRPCSVPGLPFCNGSLSITARAADLVARLSPAEKLAQLSTYSFAKKYNHRFTPPVPRLGLPGYSYHTEGLHGVRDSYVAGLNATLFPQVTAMAATANASLVHEMARVMGVEARGISNVYLWHLFHGGRGGHCEPPPGRCDGNVTDLCTRGGFLSVYGPTINIIRDPRWGRAQESVSEDPYLNGLYAASFVRGLQGDVMYGTPHGPNTTLLAAATCKHAFAYSFESGEYNDTHWTRHRFQANVSAQELEETYLPAFRACVEGGNPQQVMCSYNAIAVRGAGKPTGAAGTAGAAGTGEGTGDYNATPACLDGDLLNGRMRGDWGFRGNVVADCDAISDAKFAHHWGPGRGDGGNASAEAVVAAGLEAGCDMDCGSFYTDYGPSALAKGVLRQAAVDTALRRIFTLRLRLGEFDGGGSGGGGGAGASLPYASIGAADVDSAAHRDAALRAAREAVVLLNNSAGLLPLDAAALRTIAVVGPLANVTKPGGPMMGGKTDYSPSFVTTPLDGIRAEFPAAVVRFEPAMRDQNDASTEGVAAALAVARASDVTIAVVGIDGDNEGEGHDRGGNLTLPGAQLPLVQALLADPSVGPGKVIVALVHGGPLLVDWVRHHAPTVVDALEGGQSGGRALAEVLSGAVAPSGVMPYTTYPSQYLARVRHEDMSMRAAPGRTYRFYAGPVLWPFGHSLSYTRWALRWSAGSVLPPVTPRAALERGVSLSVSVRNVGAVPSAKALLFFVAVSALRNATFAPPLRSLFAVSKVHVEPGDTATVTVNSSNVPGLCAFCTVDQHGVAAVRAATYTITVGDGAASQIDPMVTNVGLGLAG